MFLALALSLAPAFAEPRDHDRADADRTEQRGDRSERADRGERSERADRASDRGRAERASHAPAHAAHRDRHVPARRHRPARRHIPAHRHGPPPPPPPRVHHHSHVEVVEAEAPAPRPRAPDNDVSILVNLVDVPVPLLSGGVEFALGRKLGLAGTVGVGFSDTGALYDAGADLRGYLLGDFDRGLFVGGGLGVTNLTPVSVGVDATTFDGFVGGKYTFRGGLTFEAALGAEAYTTETIGVLSPTAKVGVGWSF